MKTARPTPGWQVALGLVVVLALPGPLRGALEVVWQQDFGAAALGTPQPGVEIVADRLASSGKSACLTYAKGAALGPLASADDLRLAGRGELRVHVRGQGLNDIANGLRLSLVLTHKTTGQRYLADGVVCAVRTREDAWRALPIYVDVDSVPAAYTLTLTPAWQEQTAASTPRVWVAGVELAAHGAATPYLAGLSRSRTAYAPGMQVRVRVTVVNPTTQPFSGRVKAVERRGLTGRKLVATAKVVAAAGAVEVVETTWKAAGAEAGRELGFTLESEAGTSLDEDRIDVGYAADARLLAFPARDFEQGWRPNLDGYLYVAPASHAQSVEVIRARLRDRHQRGGRCEFFSWSWSEQAGMIPPEDPYVGNAGPWWLSLKEYKEQIAMLRDSGTHVESYLLGQPVGQAAYELYQKHPDWFLYDRNGEHVGFYNMEVQALYQRRLEFEDWTSKKGNSMWLLFDATHPEVRRFLAAQMVRLRREMGFAGARWDVWYMESKPGWYRLDGTEVAPTWPDADRLTAESLRVLKESVAKEVPDFTWGYNYAAPEENKNIPLTFAEKCRGHGWMLDELAIGYGAKTSPFHTWSAYARRLVEWGDVVRQAGGIYDPWMFDRGCGVGYEVDWLYTTIFRVLAGGRVWNPLYKNNSALVGDIPRLAFRFSALYSGWDLRLQPEDQTLISVTAPETLWWRRFVFSNRDDGGREQALVHLVNSPCSAETLENPASAVRPPVRDVVVRCGAVGGRLPVDAFAVMAEAATPEAEPAVQAVPLELRREGDLAVSVTVPSVLFFKTVVFGF